MRWTWRCLVATTTTTRHEMDMEVPGGYNNNNEA